MSVRQQTSESTHNTLDDRGWTQLSTWSVVHYIAKSIGHLMRYAYAVIPVIYGVSKVDINWVGLLALTTFTATIVGSALLTFMNFRYKILEDRIQVKQGILFRKQINLAVDRIQNVNIEQPFYFRPLGLVTLKIDGAGSSKEEIYLSALTRDAASRIRDEIQRKRSVVIAGKTTSGIPSTGNRERVIVSSGTEFYSRSMTDLIIHGLTNNRAWIVVGGVCAIYAQASEPINIFFASLGLDFETLFTNQSVTTMAILLLTSFLLAVGIVAVLSVLGSIVTYYGFTLARSDESITVRRGLFNKHEIHVQKSRIQTIFFRQDWLDKILGRVNLIYEQLSHLVVPGLQNSKLLVPSVRLHEVGDLLEEVLPLRDPAALCFTPISIKYLYKVGLIWSLLYIIGALVILPENYYPPLILFLACSWCLHMSLLFMLWNRKGIALEKDIVVIREGIIGTDYVVFPSRKLQQISLLQSPWMKRSHIASVQFSTASRTTVVPFLNEAFAKSVLNYSLFCVEHSDESWM